jgi:hypothetical protein
MSLRNNGKLRFLHSVFVQDGKKTMFFQVFINFSLMGRDVSFDICFPFRVIATDGLLKIHLQTVFIHPMSGVRSVRLSQNNFQKHPQEKIEKYKSTSRHGFRGSTLHFENIYW